MRVLLASTCHLLFASTVTEKMCNDGIFNTGSHDGFGAIFQSPSGTIQNESCVNYDLHPRRHLYSVGIEEGTPSPVFGASFADGTVCANGGLLRNCLFDTFGRVEICWIGERLARRGLVFSKWEKTVFVIDFNEEEIRYYNAHKKGHDTAVQEGEPIGRIKFNASSDESKVGVKSLNRKYKGRNNVLG